MPSATDEPKRPARLWAVRSWPVFEMPRRVAVPVVVVELTTVALLVASITRGQSPEAVDGFRALLLCVLGLAHTEIVAGVERIRRRVTAANHVDLSSVWTFAAAIVLPPAVAAGVAVVLQFHIWVRTGRPRMLFYRQVFSTATIVLACIAASAVASGFSPDGQTPALGGLDLLGLGLALLVYTTVNSCLVAGVIAVSTPQPDLTKIFGEWDDNVLEIATLSLGGLTAVALVINPWLVLMVLPPLVVLHRAVLVRHLEEVASTDSKTGLLNAAAWHSRAERALRSTRATDGPRAVLVLDLDHFKSVNDNHGHLAGDQVLAAVADAMRAEVRDRDLVGRFGGEEFVVLLAGAEGSGSADLEAVAERIRTRVAGLRVEIPTADGPLTIAGLSISVGGAVHMGDDADLRSLLQIADAALYAAKRAGRNVVRMGPPPVEAVPVVEPSPTPRVVIGLPSPGSGRATDLGT